MKKPILLIAAALLLCGKVQAQEMAMSTTTQETEELAMDVSAASLLKAPLPATELGANYQFGGQQYASPKGWGIACIITGSLTMLSGLTVWLGGNTFGNVASTMPDGFEPDPDFQQAANTVSKGIKTAGIIGTVIGAGLVTTGIILVSSDGRSGSRHSGRNRHRRFSENLLAPEQNSPGWALSLNAGPTGGGLALTF